MSTSLDSVGFYRCKQVKYDSIEHDSNTLYFILDKPRIYLGDHLVVPNESDIVSNIIATDSGLQITFGDDTTKTVALSAGADGLFVNAENGKLYLTRKGEIISEGVDLPESGTGFDAITFDEEGYLHIQFEGEDVVDPVFIGTGGGGSGSAAGINLSNVVKPTSVRNGEDTVFSFVATSTDDTNITVNWYVDGILRSTESDKISGTTFSFNAGPYLKASDTSAVKATIASESGASLNRQWSVTSSAFSIAWGAAISPVTLYTTNENIYAVVKVSAQANTENIVTLTVGQTTFTKRVIGAVDVTFELDSSLFDSGVYTISAIMASSLDENDKSAPISYRAIWGYQADGPIVAFAKSEQAASQYDVAPIQFLAYDPNNETASCEMQIGDEAPRSLSANRTMQTLNYVSQEHGEKVVTLTCGDATDTMTLNIAQSAYNIGMVTGDNLRYSLDPMGRSNTDSDKEQFGGLTFSEGFDWVNGGFQTDSEGCPAFVVKKGHTATLPRQLFADADGNGKTVDISFRITNSDLYDAVAMKELNGGQSKGIILRANEGELRLNNTTGQLFRYCEESRIDFSLNIEAVTDQRVMTVWLDGIPSQVNTYSTETLVQNENALIIGSENCDVWIYAIRVYNTALSNKEMIQNWISLGPTTAIKLTRCQENAVYDDNGRITPETLHAAKPDLTIVHLFSDRMTTGKEDSVVPQSVTIQDGSEKLTIDTGVKFKGQGTSSSAYGRSAFNMDIDFKNSGLTYKLSENSIPVNYINIKVNVASSENANNICAADWYNTYQPYLVPARSNPGVRDTIEGKPCAVFFTNTSSDIIWIGSQQLNPGDTVLYAMGDICNSKKNTAVFGQDGVGEHYCKGCIEVSGNDTMAQQFKATSTYNAAADDGKGQWETTTGGKTSKDYEWRAEPKDADKEEVVNAWNEAVAWVVSTIGDSAKFKAEVGNYFALKSLLYHFLYLEFFAAFDNVAKNSFYSYEWDEDAQKYLWNICKNYDDDTILGCDNDGVPLADYGADFGDKAGSRSLFNADTHTIWVNIQDSCYDELSALYKELRSRGAWDGNSIISKWKNYQAIRPHAAMAQDAYNKYIAPYKTTGVTLGTEVKGYDSSYLARMQGEKHYQRTQFLTYQPKYMDGKYGYYSTSSSIMFRANAPEGTTQDLTVTAYAKTYVTLIVDNGTRVSHKIEKGGSAVFQNTSVHSNATIYVTPESLITSITPIDGIENTTFAAAGASKLQDVTLGSASTENNSWDANTPLNIPSVILKTLSIRNVVNFAQALNLAANVELISVDTRGTNTGMITLPSYAPLTSINLNACSGITALNLNKVEEFSMTNGNNLTRIRVENCNDVVNDAIAVLLQHTIDFGGDATRFIRMLGVDWTLNDGSILYDIATSWRGYNDLGLEINTPIITGRCFIGSLSQEELDVFEEAFPQLEITYGEIVRSYTVTFVNYDGTVLNTQKVKRNSAAVNPITAGLIAEPTKPSSIEYTYAYIGWDISFNHILSDTVVTAQFSESDRYYTVEYINGTVVIQTDTVIAHGRSEYTGEALSNAGVIWVGWDSVAEDVVSDMKIHASYITAVMPDQAASGYDYLYSDNPEDNSGYTLAEFYGIASSGRAKEFFNVGDKIKIVAHTTAFKDVDIELQVYGFKHYKLAGSEDFAEVVFGMVGLMNAYQQMNSSNTNVGGWPATKMRTYLNETVFNGLPQQWKSMIKPVTVLSSQGDTLPTIVWSDDKLFLFSQAEVGFNTSTVPYTNEIDPGAEEKTFSIFTDNNSRIKKTYNGTGTAHNWWLRSPYASYSTTFCNVYGYGGANSGTAGSTYGVAFGFCI